MLALDGAYSIAGSVAAPEPVKIEPIFRHLKLGVRRSQAKKDVQVLSLDFFLRNLEPA